MTQRIDRININDKSADDYHPVCFSHFAGEWTIGGDIMDGDTMDPGVYFLGDDLKVKPNMAHAILLSAKNIKAGIGLNTMIKAINYSGFKAVCNNNFTGMAVEENKTIGPMHESDGFYP